MTEVQPEKVKLTKDLLVRAGYVLGIYKSLQILLPDELLADQWLTTSQSQPIVQRRGVSGTDAGLANDQPSCGQKFIFDAECGDS